ncbi:hypothetical protein KY290_020269 [Solanum tuberosum]|uniref:Uncharacterized protein n=1 Tax=Solanum tuberosum TaxID=4113 RepID=A0ABQ7UY70_SOLTU|nr:hypothetical protein KY289_019423 [Solanum tuberosum]KAH0756776.1 hypothetical protein KY290_020269 [Solanum tuberosum]
MEQGFGLMNGRNMVHVPFQCWTCILISKQLLLLRKRSIYSKFSKMQDEEAVVQ